jgi:hypothetical protein
MTDLAANVPSAEALDHPDPPILLSGFRLRPWAATDVSALVSAWRDPEMHRWMPEEPSLLPMNPRIKPWDR